MRTVTIHENERGGSRVASWIAALAAFALLLGGCGDWLEVTNPGAIETPSLEDPTYLQLMYDGVVGDFQPAYAWTALFSGAFTDELRMHHTFGENLEFDQRRVAETNGTYALAVFNGLHRARFLADSVAGRFRVLLGDSAEHDLRLAKTLGFAGYTWTLLGEQLCETRINGQGAALEPDGLFAGAIERFDAAIAAAATASANAPNITDETLRAQVLAGADSVTNMARVGAARAALNIGDNAAAVSYADAVTPRYVSTGDPGFRFDVHYLRGNSSTETRRMGNPFWEFVSAGGSWVSISGTGYENLNDARIPHGPAGTIGVAGGGEFIVPNSPRSFSSHDGTVEGALFESTSSMRLASATEARYILAEVQGNTPANVAFLNEQRAIGGQPALSGPTADAYAAALREQRAREFFIDGHRLADVRRYEARYGVDLWPTGPMYDGSITFGDQKCFPTPVSEHF
ncbi:MAG: hypothetical protein ACREM1_22600 [Longimicrobiales bacterium]